MKNGTTRRAPKQGATTQKPSRIDRSTRQTPGSDGRVDLRLQQLDSVPAYVGDYFKRCKLGLPDDAKTFVTHVVAQHGSTCRSTVQVDMWAVSRLTEWAINEGLPLKPGVVLHASNIERFVQQTERVNGTRRSLRTRLRLISSRVAQPSGWEPPTPQIGRSPLPSPLDEREIGLLYASFVALPSNIRVPLHLMTALGLGCGFAGAEMKNVHRDDITIHSDGTVTVITGNPARTVTCRAVYEHRLADAVVAHQWTDTGALFPTVRGHEQFLSNHRHRFDRPLRLSQLRVTWLHHMLTVGLPMRVVLDAAGLISTSGLNFIVPNLPTVDPATSAQLLRRN